MTLLECLVTLIISS
ncbi:MULTISPECIES: prepilin-type N-terminal cleavage/methylation domain-containing protein [Bacillus]